MQKYGNANRKLENIFFCGRPASLTQDKETTEYFAKRIMEVLSEIGGPVSSVGIATGHRVDGPGMEFLWGEIFRTFPDRPWGPRSLLCNGYRVLPGGKEGPGRDTVPSPTSSAGGHERVEL